AVVFGTFVAAMTVMRLAGTRLIDRFGRVTVLRASGVASIAGLLLFGFAPTLGLAGVGVVLWGFGAALAVPVGIAAASDEPLRAAGRVSVVSAFASMASLAAPPLLGLAAEAVGARHALVLIVGAMLLSVALARPVAPLRAAAPASGTSRPAPAGRAGPGPPAPGRPPPATVPRHGAPEPARRTAARRPPHDRPHRPPRRRPGHLGRVRGLLPQRLQLRDLGVAPARRARLARVHRGADGPAAALHGRRVAARAPALGHGRAADGRLEGRDAVCGRERRRPRHRRHRRRDRRGPRRARR